MLTRNFIIGVTLGMIFLVVGVVLVQNIAEDIALSGSQADCASSVRINANLKTDLLSFTSEVNCPTHVVRVSENPSSNDALIKKKIANEMAKCWRIYGEGDLTLFDDASGQRSFCSVCSVLQFDHKGESVVGVQEYLVDHRIAPNGATYWEYLYPPFDIDLILGDEAQLADIEQTIGTGDTPLTIAGATAKFDRFKEYLAAKEPVIDTTNDVAVVFVQGKYSSSGLQRYLRWFLDMPTLVSNSAVYHIPYTASEFSELDCSAFPVRQDEFILR